MSDYGEIFSSKIPGVKMKKQSKKMKRSYAKDRESASSHLSAEAASSKESAILTEILGEHNVKIYRQASVLVELLELVPRNRRRRAATLIAKIQQGTLKFF